MNNAHDGISNILKLPAKQTLPMHQTNLKTFSSTLKLIPNMFNINQNSNTQICGSTIIKPIITSTDGKFISNIKSFKKICFKFNFLY